MTALPCSTLLWVESARPLPVRPASRRPASPASGLLGNGRFFLLLYVPFSHRQRSKSARFVMLWYDYMSCLRKRLRFASHCVASLRVTSAADLAPVASRGDARLASPETQKPAITRRSMSLCCSMIRFECGLLNPFLNSSHLLIIRDPFPNGLLGIAVYLRGLVCFEHISLHLVEMD